MDVPKEPPAFELIPLTRTRQAISERVSKSRQTIPHFDLFAQVDASALVEYRQRRKEREGEDAPTYNDLFIYIVARVLPGFPVLNAWYEESGLKTFAAVNLGFAVQTHEGVLLPTVFNANEKALRQISEEARELTRLAREGRLRASLQRYAGFTISNMGPSGIVGFNAVISPPQTGILAIGPLARRPLVAGDELAVRTTAWLTLTVDHRVVDGQVGASFLSALKERIESWSGEEGER
jgi:pyruvate dehydrogenase E2 component (dihydrolipoamide acetyltransferase)